MLALPWPRGARLVGRGAAVLRDRRSFLLQLGWAEDNLEMTFLFMPASAGHAAAW